MVCETQLYDLLSVSAAATLDQIAKSYKKLALKYHPDKTNHNPEFTEKFKDVCRAYEILKDPRQREIYDVYGMKGLDGSLVDEPPQQPNRGFNVNRQPQSHAHGFEQTIFSQLFDGMATAFGSSGAFSPSFGNPFSSDMNFGTPMPGMCSTGASRTVRPDRSAKGQRKLRKGANIHHNFKVSLADMFFGKEAKFSLPTMTKCSFCNGVGCLKPKTCATCEGSGRLVIQVANQFAQFQENRECAPCRGTGIYHSSDDVCTHCDHGFKMQTKLIKVRIPPGSKNGDKCVLLGQSDEGIDMTPGDVIIHLEEQPHPFLVRQQNDLFMEHDIDLRTALLGGKIIISDFPRTGEDVILYVNVHGKKHLNDHVHPSINSGEVVGTINSGVPKLVKGLGMPINNAIKDGRFVQNPSSALKDEISSYKRGDLYIKFNVQLPEIQDFAGEEDLQTLQKILPARKADESFGTIAWEHHLSNIPDLEPFTSDVEPKSQSEDERVSSDDFDYDQLDVDSQDGSEEQEDNQFYAQKWSKEHQTKRQRVDV